MQRIGLIAGNGKFPLLVLDAARAAGYEAVVVAIKEEAFAEIEDHGAASVHWLSLGELSKLIEIFHRESVSRAIMAGAGEAHTDFLRHPAGLAVGQASALAYHAQYRQFVRRGSQGPGGRRDHTGEFHLAARTAAGEGRCAYSPRSYRARTQEYRLRARRAP